MLRRNALSPEEPSEPWRSFLTELDNQLSANVELHCLGGFVITQVYGLPRDTSDVDCLDIRSEQEKFDLEAIAGRDSPLFRKFRLYVQRVGVVTAPVEYATRLLPLYSNAGWSHLKLFALEAHDLALSKLERNLDRDRRDVRFLFDRGRIRPDIIRTRYYDELRPYLLSRLEWHDKTLEMWLDSWAESADTRL
jgi:hypothetical protein